MIHRDSMHKLHREEVLAAQGIQEVALSKKQVILLMKYDKAPWKTSAFGRRLREARELVDAPAGANGRSGHSPRFGDGPKQSSRGSQGRSRQVRQGPYGHRIRPYLREMGRPRKEWHLRLFFMIYAQVLEGKNPLHCLTATRTDDDPALGPQVIKVNP